MFRLLYVSTAHRLINKNTLVDILKKSREKNSALDVTGMLFYKDGNFMQLLEGDEATVRALYDTICNDTRHSDSTVIVEEPVSERYFPNWSMGFSNLDDAELKSLPGFSEFENIDFSRAKENPDIESYFNILKFFHDPKFG